jgi:hypothetical protein
MDFFDAGDMIDVDLAARIAGKSPEAILVWLRRTENLGRQLGRHWIVSLTRLLEFIGREKGELTRHVAVARAKNLTKIGQKSAPAETFEPKFGARR